MAILINGDTSNGLKLTSDNSGIIELQSGGTTKATVNSSGLTSPGHVLQVVQVQKTDVFTTTSSSLVDVTGLTLNITPTATSSKILFMASVAGVGTDNSVVQAYRDSTIIAGGDASGSRTQSFTGSLYNGIFAAPTLMTASINWLDTPSTTSAITYKIKAGAVGGGTLYLGRNATDNDDAQHTRAPQVITLMEIAG